MILVVGVIEDLRISRLHEAEAPKQKAIKKGSEKRSTLRHIGDLPKSHDSDVVYCLKEATKATLSRLSWRRRRHSHHHAQ